MSRDNKENIVINPPTSAYAISAKMSVELVELLCFSTYEAS